MCGDVVMCCVVSCCDCIIVLYCIMLYLLYSVLYCIALHRVPLHCIALHTEEVMMYSVHASHFFRARQYAAAACMHGSTPAVCTHMMYAYRIPGTWCACVFFCDLVTSTGAVVVTPTTLNATTNTSRLLVASCKPERFS